jgi:hypothetical protein
VFSTLGFTDMMLGFHADAARVFDHWNNLYEHWTAGRITTCSCHAACRSGAETDPSVLIRAPQPAVDRAAPHYFSLNLHYPPFAFKQ